MKEIIHIVMLLFLLGPFYARNIFYKKDKDEYKLWVRIAMIISVICAIISDFFL